MFIRILFSVLVASLSLSACAKTPAGPNGEPKIVLTAAQDPDGDGENKGWNYFPKNRPATGNKVFIFDPNYGAWAVYDENGQRVNVGRASGGQLYCADVGRSCKTIAGTFKIMRKRGADCKSSVYPIKTRGGAPIPYCMLFEAQGYSIHGSNDVPDYNASHGCIRVNPIAARWLNQDFLSVGSTVIVLPYQSPPSRQALNLATGQTKQQTTQQIKTN